MYFRLIMEGGHVGAGKSIDAVRYFRAENAVELFGIAARMPRVKRKSHQGGVKLIQPVSREEYERGVSQSRKNPYLARRKGRKAS